MVSMVGMTKSLASTLLELRVQWMELLITMIPIHLRNLPLIKQQQNFVRLSFYNS